MHEMALENILQARTNKKSTVKRNETQLVKSTGKSYSNANIK